MSNEENYIIENETTDTAKKQEYWNTGIGLNKVDYLEPSKYLLELSKKNINGELAYTQVEDMLKTYYETQNTDNPKLQKEKECDLVSLRIAQLLEDKSFGFSPITLKNIHRYLFKDIYDFSGNYRDYNISKKEPKFTSSIWQVHPFGEGNTRTTAVFIEKYLNNMGFDVNNNMFKDYSLYFRNALVRSNYANIPKGIYSTFDYLIMFFENLLQGKNNELKNRELYVKELFESNE